MKIVYLTNQYPKTSHAFIRREILALEGTGMAEIGRGDRGGVQRITIRQTREPLADPADREELARTRVLLQAGVWRIVLATLATLLGHPINFGKAARTAWALARCGHRSLAVHGVYLAEACLLRRWLAAERVDHVHVHFGTNPTTIALLCRRLGGPGYSFTVHGPEEFDRPETLGLGEKIEGAAFVVGVSDFGRSQLYRWCAYEQWAKIHVVHCGVDAVYLGVQPAPVPHRPRFVCVGRLCEQKGQLLLIEAMGRLATAGVKLELVLVGDGPMREEIERQIHAQGLEASVRITGWASGEQVRQEILAARALVLPSFAEGLPVVIMEALALGRPVISTYVAGIPELVEHGVNGWLVPAGSVEALAAALREALEMPMERLAAMGQAGAVRVRERHDARIEAGKLAELFRRCVPRRAVAQTSPTSEALVARQAPTGVRV